jgi:hypothetical protein
VSRPLLFAACLAACLAVPAVAFAEGASPAAATPAQRDKAQDAFVRGRELYMQKKYPEARAAFAESLEHVASPNARLYLARAERDAGHLVDAYRAYGRTIDEAQEAAATNPSYQQAAIAAAEERAELEPKLAFVTVEARGARTISIGGDPTPRAGERVAMMPGRVEIIARGERGQVARASVDVAGGEHKTVTLTLDAAPTPAPAAPAAAKGDAPPSARATWRTAAYVSGGVGVAGLATFAVFGLLSQSTHGDLERGCGAGPCPPERADDVSAGRTQQTVANVGLAVGAVGLAAGVTLFVLTMPRSSAQARVSAAPGWVGVRGTF